MKDASDQAFNLFEVFETVAKAVPERECIIYGEKRFSYAQILDRTNKLAVFLNSRGLGVSQDRSALSNHESGQDHVGIYLYNSNEFIESMLASYQARCAPFNVNYRYVKDELVYLLRDAQTRCLIFDSAFAQTLKEVLPEVGTIDLLIQVNVFSQTELLDGAVSYDDIIAQPVNSQLHLDLSPDDLYILYTGGTTGMPKGVLWRQHDIFMAAMGGRKITNWEIVQDYESIRSSAINGSALKSMPLPPLMHGAAQWMSFMGLTAGGTIVFPPRANGLDAKDCWETIEREKVNIIAVVGDAMAKPLIEEFERKLVLGEPYDHSSLFAIGNGGAPMSKTVKEKLLSLMGSIVVSDSVGSSETGAQASHISVKDSVQTGNFVPGPGAVVIDASMSRLLEPGEEEIGWLGQVGWVPLGYLGDRDKTSKTFPEIDGKRYSIPGDRARIGPDGNIELLGRDSITINSGGEKIFAEEVELAITSHQSVEDCIVVGRKSEQWGQEVVALVKLKDNTSCAAGDLINHASASIARYKLPKEILMVDYIQRSPAGKADYRWAQNLAEDKQKL